jgi:hypothetical protein
MPRQKYTSIRNHPYNKKDFVKDTPNKEQNISKIKTREIMRCIYPINNCGSKQVIISFDVEADFMPTLTIGKTGWSGLTMTPDVFTKFHEVMPRVHKFFTNKDHASNEKFFINHDLYVETKFQWNKKMISLNSEIRPDMAIVLTQPTWESLIAHIPLISHIMQKYQLAQNEVNQVYKAMMDVAREASQQKQNAIDALMKLTYNDLYPYLELISSIDTLRVFLELRTTCLEVFDDTLNEDMLLQSWCE